MNSSESHSLSTATAFLLLTISSSTLIAQPVTTEDLENAASDNASWLTYGRDYSGQRFVDLDQRDESSQKSGIH